VHPTPLQDHSLSQPLLSTRSWVLLWQTWTWGCNQEAPSNALPRHCSCAKVNLFSSVDASAPCGNPTLHSFPLNLLQSGVYPHELAFGNKITHLKDNNALRVSFCNIGGFPLMNHPNEKAQELKHFMVLYDIDLFGGSKANLNWSKLPDLMHLQEWFHDVLSCHTFLAHNSTKNINQHQFGRTF